MRTRILQKLAEIERERNIEILFAVESGSRAWGFASPDSDYDIRFVYKRKLNDYLDLWETKDTIQFMTEDELDGSGWDVRKALGLLSKSNASLLGWLFSPIVYIDNGPVLEEMKTLARNNFSPVSGFYHYHSMNKGFDDILGSEEMNLKSFFYAMRTSLCAKWILVNESIPPVLFAELFSLLSENEIELLNELIELKSKAIEKAKDPIDKRLISLAHETVLFNNENKESAVGKKPNKEEFNSFFVNLLK
jgi:predicted nucleotidyltransferase